MRSGEVVGHPAPVRGILQTKCPDDLQVAEREQVFRWFVAVQLDDRSARAGRRPPPPRRPAGRRRLPPRITDGGSAAMIAAARAGWIVSRRAGMKIEPDPVDARCGASHARRRRTSIRRSSRRPRDETRAMVFAARRRHPGERHAVVTGVVERAEKHGSGHAELVRATP